MGYANPVITRHFPELAGDGDDVWVTIRNPRTVPPGEMMSRGVKVTDQAEAEDNVQAQSAGNAVMAKLIIGWRVYDGSWVPQLDPDTGEVLPGQDQPRLPMPATPEAVARLPLTIWSWLGEELGKVNPQVPNAGPEAPISRT